MDSEEGFKGLAESKIMSYHSRIESKIDTQDKISQLTAANTTREGNTVVDIQSKGEAILQQAMDCKEKLLMLHAAVVSYKKEDDDSLEGTGSYLVRAYQDAARCGVRLPLRVLEAAIQRQCVAMLNLGNTSSAIACLDPAADMVVGIKLLAHSVDVQSEAQVESPGSASQSPSPRTTTWTPPTLFRWPLSCPRSSRTVTFARFAKIG